MRVGELRAVSWRVAQITEAEYHLEFRVSHMTIKDQLWGTMVRSLARPTSHPASHNHDIINGQKTIFHLSILHKKT